MPKQDCVSFANSRFNPSIKINPGGSIFLGYLYTEVVVSDVLVAEDGTADLKIGCPDIQVRITVDGKPRIEFPSDEVVIKGKTERVARYFSASKATREALTTLVFSLDAVSLAVETAERMRAAAAAA